jgi:GTP-binding protein
LKKEVNKNALFIKSSDDYKKCPEPKFPEFAFIGRSNVGKSSLINMVTGEKNLAKTSSKPGKTRLINHFLINEKWFLVDLPGYGYARVSKSDREKFEKFIKEYILNREKLYCLFVLIDSRIEPQQIDLDFINWLGENQIPFVIVYTKTDKLSANKIDSNISKFKKTLLKEWDALPDMFYSSTITQAGKAEILDFINNTISSIS